MSLEPGLSLRDLLLSAAKRERGQETRQHSAYYGGGLGLSWGLGFGAVFIPTGILTFLGL